MKKTFAIIALGIVASIASYAQSVDKATLEEILNKDYSVGLELDKQSHAQNDLCPDGNHPHLIDLGLPSGTKWACCNMDAKAPDMVGRYYSWGDTKPKYDYSSDNYTHWAKHTYRLNAGVEVYEYYKSNIGKNIAASEHDVAHVKWGGAWRMPTEAQWLELMNECNRKWVTLSGVHGVLLTGANGNSIFLPAAGYRDGKNMTNGNVGYYRAANVKSETRTNKTQTPATREYLFPFYLTFGEDSWSVTSSSSSSFDYNYYCGLLVRPVVKPAKK